jgi:hypothetical protein
MKNLYRPKIGERINITQEQLDEIRKCESRVTESAYYEHMVVWDTELTEEMQMLAITAKPKQWVVDKYAENIEVHMALLSTIYIDGLSGSGDEGTSMGYKRPFGNSDVIGDVMEEMRTLGRIANEIDEDGNQIDIIDEVPAEMMLEEFAGFIRDFFADGFEPTVTGFIGIGDNYTMNKNGENKWKVIGVEPKHSYLYCWEPDKSALRDIKLNNLGI